MAVQLYYSQSGTQTWTWISSVLTIGDGSFLYNWEGASSLLPGPYVVNATFLGNAEFDRWTGLTDLQVTSYGTDFLISATPQTEDLYLGTSKLFTIDLESTADFDLPVSLTIQGLPFGLSASFTPVVLDPVPDGHVSSSLLIYATMSTPQGTYAVTIKGASGTLEHRCQVSITVKATPDYFRTAENHKLVGEQVYLWQTIQYKQTAYFVLIYSRSVFPEFSIKDEYIDQPVSGHTRIKAMLNGEKQWVDIEGVIVVDESGSMIKNDEASRSILTLAEAQAYYRYLSQNNIGRNDYKSYFDNLETKVNDIYANPLFWPTMAIYRTSPELPLVSEGMYRELLADVFSSRQSEQEIITPETQTVADYILSSTGVIDSAAEYLELQNYKQFLSQSNHLGNLIEQSDYLDKLDRNLKDLFDKLGTHDNHIVGGKCLVKFLIGLAVQKTAAEECLPYLKSLQTYLQTNPKTTYDSEWRSLLNALNEIITMSEGSYSIWYRAAYQAADVAMEYLWDRAKEEVTEALKTRVISSLATRFGLSIGKVGSMLTPVSIGVSVGIIVGDILFDLSGMYRNMDLMVKAKKLNNIVSETYNKISSSQIDILSANIETRRLQFSLIIKSWDMLAENADGTGITGVARSIMNFLLEFVQRLLGQDVQSAEEFISIIRTVQIPYFTLLKTQFVPPMHYISLNEPEWDSGISSSTMVIRNLMYLRRGIEDPELTFLLNTDRCYYVVNENGILNLTIINPSNCEITDICVNATIYPGTSISPIDVHLISLQPNANETVTFDLSFTQPGIRALAFWITAENGTYVYFECAWVHVYLSTMVVSMNPSSPKVNDDVALTVKDTSDFPVCNATVFIQTPQNLINLTTDASGIVSFRPSAIGLWSITVECPNRPTYGPYTFVVGSAAETHFVLDINDVNATTISANGTYCKGFRIINDGLQNLQINLELLENSEWLTGWVISVDSNESLYENAAIISETNIEVNLPSGHWTCGYMFLSIAAGTTYGSQAELILNATSQIPDLFHQEILGLEVNAQSLSITIDTVSTLFQGENLATTIRISDMSGLPIVPDTIAARLNQLNTTGYLSPIGNGLYNLTVPNLLSGEHLLEVTIWKTGYECGCQTLILVVEERSFEIHLSAETHNTELNLVVTLIDSISNENVPGASVWAMLEAEGNKTMLIFVEGQQAFFNATVDCQEWTQDTHFNLTIFASKNGYCEEAYSTILQRSIHDLMVDDVVRPKTVVGQGYSLKINVTVDNQGDYTETFNVTIRANETIIETLAEITLTSRNFTILTFTWNTTGFTLGNYTIGAYAWPVPGETSTADNNFTGGWVIVSLVGDISGPDGWPDGKVDMRDIGLVARHFGETVPPAPVNCDLTGPTAGVPDGKIDMRDIGLVARHFGDHYP
jgi:hypothetical protein